MDIWLIQPGEPLPIEDGSPRLWRTGLLAEELVQRGHSVLWWASAFSHNRKKFLFRENRLVEAPGGYQIQLLYSIGYKSNISLRRIVNHHGLAYQFRRLSPNKPNPQIIVCSYPTIELSRAAVDLGRRLGTPIILDVRDLWPTSFLKLAPSGLGWIARVMLHPMFRSATKALSGCDGIISVSQGYLDWALRVAGRPATDLDRVFPLGYQGPNVDQQELRAASRSLQDRGVDPSKTICWFIGFFGRTYDLQTVIKAARQCELLGLDDLQFVLSGDGDQGRSLQRQASGLTNVVFTGWIGLPEIDCLMRWSKIGLNAYGYNAPQGLPNKLFEYLCARVAILSSLRGETSELLTEHDCGMVYEGPDQLVDALEYLSVAPDRLHAMSENAGRLFDDRFDARHIYPQMADFIEEAAENHLRERQSPRVL